MTTSETLTNHALSAELAVTLFGWECWLEKRGEYTYFLWVKDGREPWKKIHRDYQEAEQKRYTRTTPAEYDAMKHIAPNWPEFTSWEGMGQVLEAMRELGCTFSARTGPFGYEVEFDDAMYGCGKAAALPRAVAEAAKAVLEAEA